MKRLVLGIVLSALLIGTLTLTISVHPIKAGYPLLYTLNYGVSPTPPNNEITYNPGTHTYDFHDNFNARLDVQEPWMTIDGHGYRLYGDDSAVTTGIEVESTSGHITIKDLTIEDFETGIKLESCPGNRIQDCKIWSNTLTGIRLWFSFWNNLTRNEVTSNGGDGIWLDHSSNNTLRRNNIKTNNLNGILLGGESPYNKIYENNATNNQMNGILIRDFSDNNTIGKWSLESTKDNHIVSNGANGILVYRCKKNAIENNNITLNNDNGVELYYSSNNTIIRNNEIRLNWNGVLLNQSSWNNITYSNVIERNNRNGVYLNYSTWNRIEHWNSMCDNNGNGIELDYSSNNTITDWNQVNRNIENGMYLYRSPWNNISKHYIWENHVDGILLFESSWNNIGKWNRIRNNANCGIRLYSSSYNDIHEDEIFNGFGAFMQQVGIALYEHSENNTITKCRPPYTTWNFGIDGQDYHGVVLQSSNNNVSDNQLIGNKIYGIAICGVPADNNTISKNNIIGSGTTGIWVCDCQNNQFLDNNITKNGFGIEFYHAYQMTVKYNNITQNSDAGVTITYGSTATLWSNNLTYNKWGVYLFIAGSYNLIVLNNVTANSPSEGIVVHLTSDCWICYNWVKLNNHGIYLIESSRDAIYGNFIDRNVNDGIRLESNSNNNVIHHNDIYNSQNGIHESLSSSSPGNHYFFNSFSGNTADMNLADSSLSLSDISGESEKGSTGSSGDVIAGNTIANATCGIYIHGSSNFTIYNNNIANNTETGIVLESSDNKIYHNNFINNTRHANVTSGYSNEWDNGYPFGGNYWDDYTGEDLNGDGIGDTPYMINKNNTDTVVLIEPYVPDAAITEIKPLKTVIAQGCTANINITVANQGNYMENLNFTVYINDTAIASQVLAVPRWDNIKITVAWNTTGYTKGYYNITAVADTVPGETNTTNNICINGIVEVLWKGDVNKDDVVDGVDIVIIIDAIPSYPGHPKWNPYADINCDDIVDGQDAVICIDLIPKTYP